MRKNGKGESTGGVHKILSLPNFYSCFQNILGASQNREKIVHDIAGIKPGATVLDIGCGPADIFSCMPEVHYVGIDHSPLYINQAQERYGPYGTFICGDVRSIAGLVNVKFDFVLAIGLFHHLDDDLAKHVFSSIQEVIKPGGKVIAIDPALEKQQNLIARLLVQQDRGQHIRSASQYAKLAQEYFSSIQCETRNDMLRVPYTHAVLTLSV